MHTRILMFLLFTFSNSLIGQVLINNTNDNNLDPNSSAVLELRSTDKGFLPPRMTKTERQNINNPAIGLMIYLIDNDVQCLQVYDGIGWADIYCPPENTAPEAQNVSISGIPTVGSTLTGSYTYFDAQGDEELSQETNWYSIPDANSTNYTSLNNSTNTYTIQSSDLNKYIVYSVTPKSATGLQQGEITYSDPIGPIKENVPISTNANINEFHYDNASTDENEFVEIRVEGDINNQPANVGNLKVILYNGSNGTSYKSLTLSNIAQTCDANYCYYVWEPASIQNGSPDGIALIDYNGAVIEFLSYEGTLTATNGDANGYTSTDVGVSEGNAPIGSSIFLDSDDTWKFSSGVNTKSAANY